MKEIIKKMIYDLEKSYKKDNYTDAMVRANVFSDLSVNIEGLFKKHIKEIDKSIIQHQLPEDWIVYKLDK